MITSRNRHMIIGRALAGWHADGIVVDAAGKPVRNHTYSSSGGDLYDYTYAGKSVAGYATEAPDGTPIYDVSMCDVGAIIDWACKGPMVLADYRDQPDRDPMEWKSLDYASPSDMMRITRAWLPDGMYGVVQNGVVVWD